MINISEFTIRIQEILTFYKLSASAFAEKLNVGRSSISHIMSGRNKPSLEFVLHILDNFEEVNFDWLMFGKGNFPNTINKNTTTLFDNKNISLFDKLENKPVDKITDHKESNTLLNSEIENNAKKRPNIGSTDKEIERVVLFFKDGTFKEYKN